MRLIGLMIVEGIAHGVAGAVATIGAALTFPGIGLMLAGAWIHDFVWLPLNERRERLQGLHPTHDRREGAIARAINEIDEIQRKYHCWSSGVVAQKKASIALTTIHAQGYAVVPVSAAARAAAGFPARRPHFPRPARAAAPKPGGE
ncbi:MAG: hypothetical protein ACOY4R_27570 [Pseudomonadota bacterium]